MELSGLGGPWTVRTLTSLIREHHPALVFLAETKCPTHQVEVLKHKFDMFRFGVETVEKSGCLAVLWDKNTDVQLQSFSRNHIDVSIKLYADKDWWRFTGFYGDPDVSKRDKSWKLLSNLRTQSARPWLCAGDFNELFISLRKQVDN
ncbi:UNVERIFIED_CONTAM: hypothetical protein Slati_3928000 [Sesamum latifolium]|uniref:Endonuclease/exonuclease/phosphatase domain-containing protein n=1 Tax=Sesamum latifolium TaxID=2727402 RepID=A0AAW2TRB7_9LAMI